MTDINRRNLIALAGTSIALSACTGGSDNASPNEASNWNGDTWGNPATNDAPTSISAEVAFKPAYLCVVYLQLDPQKFGALKVRHSYLDAAGLSGAKEQEAAEALLLEARTATDAEWVSKPGDILRKEKNFEKFSFGSQQRIYLVIDNDNIVFDDRKDEKGQPAALVRFTRYGPSADSDRLSLVDRAVNNSFFSAKTIEASAAGPFKGKKLLTLNNWYTGKDGTPINPKDPKTYQTYAMDIRILMMTSDTGGTIKMVPIVIDPDTVNHGRRP